MAIITDIVQTKKNKSQMYEIFVDDESIGLYHIETIIKHNLQKNIEIEKTELETILIESNTLIAMEKTLNLISKSMKTQSEIKRYLKDKGFALKVVDNVINKLKEYNYLNDELYAKYYTNCNLVKFGKKKIRFELTKKGVDEKIIDAVLNEYDENVDAIKKLAEKYLKNKDKDFKTKAKLFSHLASKGFDFDNINKIISEFNWSNNNEDWL